jgi:ATP-dependent Clp protease ATP-binding subunit ClpA
MFERFTERARGVIVASGDIARELRSPSVRRHHMLIALIDAAPDGSDAVAAVFDDAGVDRADLRAKLAASVLATESQTEPTTEKLPLTAEAKMTIEVALREALSMGHNYIGREHLLLAILRSAGGPLAEVLGATKLTHEQARGVIAEKSPPSAGGIRRQVREARIAERVRRRMGQGASPALQRVLQRAYERPESRGATTGDLLIALLETPGTHFAAALAGVTLPDVASVTAQVDKLIADRVPDGIEDALKVDRSGAVTINDPRITEALKNIVGEGSVTTEQLNEILRRLQG